MRLTLILIACLILCSFTKISAQCNVAPSASNDSKCAGGQFLLQAISFSPSLPGNFAHKWYTSATGGTLVSNIAQGFQSPNVYISSLTSTSTGTVTYYVASVCGVTESARTPVTFTAIPPLNIGIAPSSSPSSVCGSDFSLTATNATNYRWYLGDPDLPGYLSLGSAQTIYPTTTGDYYLVAKPANCSGSADQKASMNVKFAPMMTVPDITGPSSRCQGSGTTQFNSVPTNASYNWSVLNGGNYQANTSGLITWDASFEGTPTIQINATGCTGTQIQTITKSFPFTVKKVPTASVTPSTEQICSGKLVTIFPQNPNNVAGTTYAWTVSQLNASGASESPDGTYIIETLTATSNINGMVTYSITPKANGCSGTPVTAVVAVKPLPTASASDQAICSGESTNIVVTNPNNVAGTTYDWSVSQSGVGGTFSGYDRPIDSPIAQTLTATFNETGTAKYTLKPKANGCDGPTSLVEVKVKPKPKASAPDQTICSGQKTDIAITNTNNIPGTTYTWIVSHFLASGGSSTGGSTIAQTLTADTNMDGEVTYTITPKANGCSGPTETAVATVKPLPTAAASNQAICSGEATSIPISNPNNLSGTTFSWTVSHDKASGGSSAGGSTTIVDALTAETNEEGKATYKVTPLANSCPGEPITVVATVKPRPTASASDQAICSGETTNIDITSNVSGTTYSWTATHSNASGEEPGSGSTIAQTLLAATSVNGTVTYTIAPSANGCSGTPATAVATVKPRPSADAVDQSVFSGNACNIEISNPNNINGTTFSWTVWQSNVIDATDDIGSTISQVLTTLGEGNGTATYSITPMAQNCTGPTKDVIVSVIKPVITAPTNRLAMGELILDGGANYDSYLWKDELNTGLGSSQTYTATKIGTYTLSVTKSGILGIGAATFAVVDQFDGLNMNYIISNSLLVPVTSENDVENLTVNSRSQSIQYFDELGRPFQTVVNQGSPTKKDIVQPVSLPMTLTDAKYSNIYRSPHRIKMAGSKQMLWQSKLLFTAIRIKLQLIPVHLQRLFSSRHRSIAFWNKAHRALHGSPIRLIRGLRQIARSRKPTNSMLQRTMYSYGLIHIQLHLIPWVL